MILSLGSEVVPGVTIVLSATELAAGQAWELEAVYVDGLQVQQSYQPRGGSGVGAGQQIVLADHAAPINRQVQYRLLRGGVQVATASIARASRHADVLVSLDGRTAAGFRRSASGGDARQGVRRGASTDVPGNPYPPTRLAPVAGKGGGTLVAHTTGVDTARLRDLLDGNGLCYVLHSCDLPGCDIPLTELAWVSADENHRLAGGLPVRVWSLAYVLVADPEPALVMGVSSWADFDAHFAGRTWAAFNAYSAGKSWADFALVDWSAAG